MLGSFFFVAVWHMYVRAHEAVRIVFRARFPFDSPPRATPSSCQSTILHPQSSSTMSSPSQTISPPSNLKLMLDVALDEYKKKTGDDLFAHWLADELQTCESVDAVLDILRDQAKAFGRSGNQKLMKWIDPLVHVLYTFSGALGDGVSLLFPPAKVIFTGVGVLLVAAKDVRASHSAIIDLFERIESFFKRLEVYTEISLTTGMVEVLVKIVIELLSILSTATKEVKRRRAKLFFRKLLGRTDIKDALNRLDVLIQEESQMAMAQILNDMEEVKWTLIEQDVHNWLSPPDPSTNYNIGCKAHYEGTAAWFFDKGTKFNDWISIGSLLWIHGKPGSGKSVLWFVIFQLSWSTGTHKD
ncbi:hypothetical protein EDB86DRAFT_1183432 [Lactarius hatsudake]|nr:hypothetical protein EDB86DRAFT_1183432 [Lactarius hatsudake]